MYPEKKRHKLHTKVIFILAESRVETEQRLQLAELDNNQKNINMDTTNERRKQGRD